MTVPEMQALARRAVAVGFPGACVADAPLAALRAFAPGAIVLFGRNVATPADLAELVRALRANGSPPPLIAVDQEGGRVARVRDGVTALPSAMALGALGDAAVVESLGAQLGGDLARLGISVDFAPVADLALHAANTVIGTRAYGADADRAGTLASAMVRGLARGGVAAAVKHFPGHGDTVVDSHRDPPRLTTSAAVWRARELVAFRRALATAPALLMTAHVVLEAFDAALPATLSPRVLSLVRGELGFAGVIVTDCLEMDAIVRGPGTAQAAWQALAAGADLVLISHRLEVADVAVTAIVDAVARGDLPLARLRDAASRVDALRARLATLPSSAPDAAAHAVSREVAARAVTEPRAPVRLRDGCAVTIVSFEGTTGDGVNAHDRLGEASLALALRERRVRAELLRVPLAPDDGDVELLLAHLELQPEHEVVVLVRRADLYAAQAAAVARLLERCPSAVIVSVREPYDVLLWPAARRLAATYGDDALTFDGLAEVLLGRVAARGRFPVPVAERSAVG